MVINPYIPETRESHNEQKVSYATYNNAEPIVTVLKERV